MDLGGGAARGNGSAADLAVEQAGAAGVLRDWFELTAVQCAPQFHDPKLIRQVGGKVQPARSVKPP